jgi:hypothetical protein
MPATVALSGPLTQAWLLDHEAALPNSGPIWRAPRSGGVIDRWNRRLANPRGPLVSHDPRGAARRGDVFSNFCNSLQR